MRAILKQRFWPAIRQLSIIVISSFIMLETYSYWIRTNLLKEIQPVRLSNCNLKRYGDQYDGGYLLCQNLIGPNSHGYSYGIEGRDAWGCDLSREFGIPIYQYDCFDTRRVECPGGLFNFHEECIGASKGYIERRTFDTLENHLQRNDSLEKPLIVKMDVEGAEWDSLLQAPEGILKNIQQLAVEFHGTDKKKYLNTIRKLKNTFVIAAIHSNNFSCSVWNYPMPAEAFEVLFVNNKIAQINSTAPKFQEEGPPLLPNNPTQPDCPF